MYDSPRFVSALGPTGTKSFRLSARKLFNSYGNNAQNINKDSLYILHADKGHTFVQPDQQGAEALIVAYSAPKGRLRQLFELGIKSHVYVALVIFRDELQSTDKNIDYAEIPVDKLQSLPNWHDIVQEIKNHPTIYDIAKRICHGGNYGLGPETMRKTILKFSRGAIRLTPLQCKIYLTIYHALFPEIRMWHAIIEARVRKWRQLENFFGFPRRCEQLINPTYLRELISWIPQSTVACITHEAIIELDRRIKESRDNWLILNNKHDSFLCQVPDAQLNSGIIVCQHCMQQELTNQDGVKFIMRSEVKTSKRWDMN